MKIVAIILIFIGYGMFTAMYNQGSDTAAADFPQFNGPNITFQSLPPNCSNIIDCTSYIGKVIVNIVLGVIYLVLLVVAVLLLIVQIVALIATSAFHGIDGASPWLNALIISFFGLSVSIAIYRAIRKGDASA